jgi:hypothetical protein
VHRHLLIGRVQVGIIAAGPRDAGPRVIRDDERRHATVELKGMDMGLNPRFHLLIACRFGVGIRTGSEDGHEQGCLPDLAGSAVVNGNCGSGPVDK